MDQTQGSKKSTLLAISIVIASVIIGGSLIYSANLGSGNISPATAQIAAADAVAPESPRNNNPTIDDDVILGEANAPVTFIEFGDYQCPFCKRMLDESEGQLREEYIKTGKLKMVYRDFPLDSIHVHARAAAEASECARDQGKFWEYHDELFARQSEIPTMNYKSLAGELGLNTSQFDECLKAKKYSAEVEKDYQDGLAAGVQGTPSNFIIAGDFVKFVPGAVPYSTLKGAIEEALQTVNN